MSYQLLIQVVFDFCLICNIFINFKCQFLNLSMKKIFSQHTVFILVPCIWTMYNKTTKEIFINKHNMSASTVQC